MTKTVRVVRGLPGSGKSTWVKEQIADNPGAVRLNNDDLCVMLFGTADFPHSEETGHLLAALRESMLRTFLKSDYFHTIYVDNTNLITRTVRTLEKIAYEFDATFEVIDDFLSVPIDECIRRDSLRERSVGEAVIRRMARQANKITPGGWVSSAYVAIEPYVGRTHLPYCVIVDIDGTLAHKHPHRDIYDYSKVDMDRINWPVATTVMSLNENTTAKIIVMSGRDDDSKGVTEAWLKKHEIPYDEIYMRKTGDTRPDWIVKYELFQEHIAGRYNVALVLDDRDQVVNLWRRKLKLPTFQVADGEF